MSLIVAGRFTTFPAAEAAAQKLFERGFVEEDVNLFFVNPRGQHARFAVGGDQKVDPGSIDAAKGAGKGVTIGAVAGAIVGVALFAWTSASLLVSVIAAGVGAYVGSLIGAMLYTRDSPKRSLHDVVHHELRDSGVLVAVHVSQDNQLEAAKVLREAGGQAIERATGRWQQGRWSDFDPTREPTPVSELDQREA